MRRSFADNGDLGFNSRRNAQRRVIEESVNNIGRLVEGDGYKCYCDDEDDEDCCGRSKKFGYSFKKHRHNFGFDGKKKLTHHQAMKKNGGISRRRSFKSVDESVSSNSRYNNAMSKYIRSIYL